MTAPRCATCDHWCEGAPALSTAAPVANPLAKPNVGTCSRWAPSIVETTWFPVSVFPETHADRVCGDWTPRFDPEDGEREPIDTNADNVIPMGRAA